MGEPWRVSRKKPAGTWAEPRAECGTEEVQVDGSAEGGDPRLGLQRRAAARSPGLPLW